MSSTARRTPLPEKTPWLLEIIGALLLFLNMFMSAMLNARSAPSASVLLGAMLAPAFIGLLIIGVASMSSAMRNRRSRAKVFLVTMCLVLLGNCGNLASSARRGELNPPAGSSGTQ
jgi:hypothetical protein